MRKIRMKPRGKIFIGIFIVAVVSLIAFIIIKVSSTFPGVSDIAIDNNYDAVGILKDRAIILNQNQLLGYNDVGREIVDEKFSFEQGLLSVEDDNIFITANKNLYILDKTGKTKKEIDFPMDIRYLQGENGAMVLQGDNMQVAIDTNGNTLASVVDDNDIMIENAVSEKRNNIVFTSLGTKDNRIYSSLYLLKKDGELVMKQVLYDEIIEFTKFISDERYIVGTNKNIYIFDMGSIEKSIRVKELKAIDSNNKNIYIIDGDNLIVYDFKLSQKDKISLSTEYTDLIASSNDLVLYNDKNYARYENTKLVEGNSNKEILNILVYKNNFYIVHKDEIKKIEK